MILILVAIAWFYVAVLMAAAEAMHPQGTLLGAFFTLMLYGVGPIGIVLYLLGTPLRSRLRKRAERTPSRAEAAKPLDPHASGHPAGAPVQSGVAAKREEL